MAGMYLFSECCRSDGQPPDWRLSLKYFAPLLQKWPNGNPPFSTLNCSFSRMSQMPLNYIFFWLQTLCWSDGRPSDILLKSFKNGGMWALKYWQHDKESKWPGTKWSGDEITRGRNDQRTKWQGKNWSGTKNQGMKSGRNEHGQNDRGWIVV
jgi:hypothetical protein